MTIPGLAGGLEALLESGPRGAPPLAVLMCHPHPVFGGTMHNKVVFRAAKAAAQLGLPTLRFNFRGAGKSEGEFGEGVGEREDARAALDYLAARFPKAPICLMGFSFGAWVGMAAGSRDPRVTALAGLGLPVASENFEFLHTVAKPKLIIQGTRDIYGPQEQVETLFQTLQEPKQIVWVKDADHFFTGRLDEMQEAVREFLAKFIGRETK